MKKGKGKWLRMLKNSVVYSWKAGPMIFLSVVLSSAAKSIFQLWEIYVLQRLFTSVTQLVSGEIVIREVYLVVVEVALILLISQVIELLEYLSQGYYWRKGNGYLHSLLNKNLSRHSAIGFENSEFLNDIEKASKGCEDAPDASRSFLQMIFYYVPFCILTGVYLYNILPVMVLALLIISVSVLVSEFIRARQTYKYEDKVSDLNRRVDYYERCIVSRDHLKETRFLGVKDYFLTKYDDTVSLLKTEFQRKEKFILKSSMLLKLIDVTGYVLVFLILVLGMRQGFVSVVEFATIYYAVEKVKSALENMIQCIGTALQSIARMVFLFKFLDNPILEAEVKSSSLEGEEIILENVSFRYPGTGEDVIQNLSLHVKKGETIAIVGDNGAGKSTLVKLLIGLYQPSEGTVAYARTEGEGHDDGTGYINRSAVFQNFNKYYLSLEDNVRISAPQRQQDCKLLLQEVGLNLEKLSGDTCELLGREFGGTELSGGEWQRIAIARGIYRRSNIIVLDEPTASIDPLEESRLFELFYKVSYGRTCILVTHRMGAVKMADRILMLENGKVIEEGSHNDLMKKRGKYYDLYQLQAKWYQ